MSKTITFRVHGYWLGPLTTEWDTKTEEEFEEYCRVQGFEKDDKGQYISKVKKDGRRDRLEIKPEGLKKAYLFGTNHALPAVTLIDEDGYVVGQHAGESIEDAEMWFNHFQKGAGYDVIRVDQELVNRHIYKGEPLSILPEGLQKAFKLNQQHKGIRENVNN